MDDIIKTFKAHLYDRVTSPLLSSFLISWALWNHRLLVVLISSDMKIKEKFAYVDNFLFPTWHEVTFRGFLWPLLSTLFLIYVYPVPSRWVYSYVRKEQKRLKEIQQRIEDETPLTQEEARAMRVSLRDAARDFDKQMKERDAEIASLKEENATLNSEIVAEVPVNEIQPTETNESNEPTEPTAQQIAREPTDIELSEKQAAMLRYISDRDQTKEDWARSQFQGDENYGKFQFDIDVLLSAKLIQQTYSAGERWFSSTQAGRAHLFSREKNTL